MQNVALPSVPSSLLRPWADTDDHTTITWLDQEPDSTTKGQVRGISSQPG